MTVTKVENWEDLADWLQERISNDPVTPVEDFQDAYQAQLARENRRKALRKLGEEAATFDALWFKCWLSVMAHELGWEIKPQ